MKPTNLKSIHIIMWHRRKRFRAGHGRCQTCTRVCTGKKYLYRFTVRDVEGRPEVHLCYRCWRIACLFKGSVHTASTFGTRFLRLHQTLQLAKDGGMPLEGVMVTGGNLLELLDARPIRGPKLSTRRKQLERQRAIEAIKALTGPTQESEAALS